MTQVDKIREYVVQLISKAPSIYDKDGHLEYESYLTFGCKGYIAALDNVIKFIDSNTEEETPSATAADPPS